MKTLNKIVEIQNYLPHRHPMLMVDIITEINQLHVSTLFEIKADNLFLCDESFSEAGLIENAAQTCSAIIGQNYFFDENQQELENVAVIGFISAIKKVQIHALPKVNQTLVTQGTLVSKLEGNDYSICVLAVNTYVGEQKIAEAEMNLFLQKTTK